MPPLPLPLEVLPEPDASHAGEVLIELGIILLVLALLGRIAVRIGIPSIPLYLLAGVVMGDGGFIPVSAGEEFLEVGAEIGVVLLLLLLGLEYSPQDLRNGLKSNWVAGLVDGLANAVPGFAVGLMMGWSLTASLLLAGVTYISSSGIIARLLDDFDRVANRETPVLLSLLVMEDIVMAVFLPIMAVLLVGATLIQGAIAAGIALGVVAVAFVVSMRFSENVSRLVHSHSRELLLLTVLGLTFLVAGLADAVQVSAAVGAFLLGLTLSGQVADDVRGLLPPLRDVFGGLFFVFFGLTIDPRDLLPVLLREGGRDFGGALAWGEPQHLAPFGETSPFAGLAIQDEVTVSRQVLAEPEADLAQKTWARLQDGTPLVTAEREGRGWLVLFHVTAGPDWSTLPLSGLFPEMLERVTAFAEGGAGPATETGAAWQPDRVLTADGRLTAPPPEAEAIPAADWETAVPDARHPPGLYRRGAALEGMNVANAEFTMERFPRAAGVAVDDYGARAPRAMAGPFLILAMLLLVADAIAALVLSGRARALLRRLRPAPAGAIAGLALALLILPDMARAQAVDAPPPDGAFDVRLAYVMTGDSRVDEMSQAGLIGLSFELIQRTAVEPADPVGVNLERDELIFYPLIYWPITADAQPLSPEAAAKLDEYVRAGGTVLIDTQDAGSRIMQGGASEAMRRALAGVDVPPLQPVPKDHVLTKSFFLLDTFPGRWSEGNVWVEADPDSNARDGVSGWVVGGNDWAAAWAVDAQGRPVAALPGAEPRQREFAYRFGINLVMYVLTGNYKSDQVHVPALLERLGQ